MTDLEIQNEYKPLNIKDVARKINLESIECYGDYKAKINSNKSYNDKSNLILVTSINPTPLGEGKTTVSISLNDALNSLGVNSILCLREPSMGPVFGLKGGATGGGYAQVYPMSDINLHFTSDIHAITYANNLLCAAIDSHIYNGNILNIKKILFNRCIDINDRSLRNVEINGNETHFTITAASEMMSILTLSRSVDDLRKRIDNIIIAVDSNNNYIKAKSLNITGALMCILKDAIKPNLVQSLEGNPVIIHSGPFANVSIGCNSLLATFNASNYADYVIEEAGFGADLGAEKFFDIKCRDNLNPKACVVVVTIKALKYHGGCIIDDVKKENTDYIKKGLNNLYKHIDSIKNVFNLNLVVAINKYDTDTTLELTFIKNELEKNNIEYSVCEGYTSGSIGSITLAKKVLDLCKLDNKFKCAYNLDDDLFDKIDKVAKLVYKASKVNYKDSVIDKINNLSDEFKNYPICIAKTPYSLSSDSKNLLCDNDYTLEVTDIEIKSGAKFIIVYTGKILTLPGLGARPNYENIDILNDNIVGIF